MNCVPVAVSVNAGPPAVALAGDIDEIVGTGFGAGLIMKLAADDVPPPGAGLRTAMFTVPAELRSDAGI